jgi:hypothetical protein
MVARAFAIPLGVLWLGAVQVPAVHPPASRPGISSALASQYGEPEVVPLEEIALYPDRYQKRMVRTQGYLDPGLVAYEPFLRESGDALLLLAVVPGNDADMLRGRRVEALGVIRRIRPKQYVRGVDLDKIEDPDLPVMPAPDGRLPQLTLSFLSVFDATPLAHGGDAAESGLLRRLLDDPGTRGRKLRVVGQYRGSNLFGDLPEGASPDRDAFVLKDGEAAIWVVGKAAAGKGFRLDPRSRADSRFWLEVEGRLTRCAELPCLRASRVRMAARPAPAERD